MLESCDGGKLNLSNGSADQLGVNQMKVPTNKESTNTLDISNPNYVDVLTNLCGHSWPMVPHLGFG
jgi:hypothetical protein